MKKQIFKLTSILLAMVMVFTMFSIMPISAEETTVDLATAVANLKTAWKNLSYKDYAETSSISYYNGAGGGFGGQEGYEYVGTDAPADSVDNYTFTVTSTPATIVYSNETASDANRSKMSNYKMTDIEGIYFYYKSEADLTLSEMYLYYNSGANTGSSRFWNTATYTLPSTNGEWKLFDFVDFLKSTDCTWEDLASTRAEAGYYYISRIALPVSAASDTAVSFGNVYFVADKNIANADSLADYEWYDKAVAVDPATLNAEYNDAEDSATWQAFVSAREAVLACSAEAAEARLRVAAEKMLTSETTYSKPIESGRKYIAYETSANDVDLYGDVYQNDYVLPAQTSLANIGNLTSSVWFSTLAPGTAGASTSSADSTNYFGDMGENPYITVKIESIDNLTAGQPAQLGFGMRLDCSSFGGSGTTNTYSKYYLDVEEGKEYKIYLNDVLTNIAMDNVEGGIQYQDIFDAWKTNSKASATSNKFFARIFILAALNAQITVDVGSIVDAPSYEITSTKTGAEFVAEMAALDISTFGNTAEFEAALTIALEEFPEAAALVAVEKLRTAATEMVTSQPSYAYPIMQGRTGVTMTATNDSYSEFGDYYYELTLPNYGKSINASIGTNSIWIQTQVVSGNDTLYFGDMGTDPYFTVEVSSTGTATQGTLGFFLRMCGTGAGDYTSGYTKTVVAGNTYKIYIKDILEATNGTAFADWETESKAGGSYYGGLFVMGAVDADITAKVGSVISKTYYTIPEDVAALTGENFVKAMASLDISTFGNTASFEAALEAALVQYPEVKKEFAVNQLRVAAAKMTTGINCSAPYPGGYYSSARVNFSDITYYTESDAEYAIFGSAKSPEHTLPVQSGRTLKGIWMTGAVGNASANAMYLYDYGVTNDTYFTVRVVSVANASASPALNFYTRHHKNSAQTDPSGVYTVSNVVAGGEYKIYIKDLLASNSIALSDLTSGTGNYIDFFAMQAGGCDITVEVGEAITTAFYEPSDKTGVDFVAEMATLDRTGFGNTEEFETALAVALECYPEVSEAIEAANASKELKEAWKSLTYIPQQINTAPLRGYQTGGSSASKTIFVDGDDASKGYLDPDTSTDVGTAYKFPVADYKDLNGVSTPYEWFVWGNVGSNIFIKDKMSSFGFWYKSEAQITSIRVIAQASTYLTTNGGVLPATGGEWKFITLEELAGTTVWNNFLANANLTDISDFRLMFTNSTARSTELYFGDLVVYGKDEQIDGIDTWSDIELAEKSANIDFSVYEENADLVNTITTCSEILNAYYASNLLAQDVIDSAANLNKYLYLKPVTTITKYTDDPATSEIKTNLYGASDNGDYTAKINTVDFGSESCSPYGGAVVYETNAPLTLAEIDDIYFSYKFENTVIGTKLNENNEPILTNSGARIWFYNEDFYREDYKTDSETGDYVLDEENNKIVTKTYDEWHCGMEAYGTTRWLPITGDTAGWEETSLATIFGDDWKTVYLEYLNANTVGITYTEENTTISKMALGFNGAGIDGDYADITLGSMFVERAGGDFTITATAEEPAEVLDQALNLDLTGVKKSVADEFKTLVKELADATNTEIISGKFIAGNYGGAVSLVDLSLLSRYVDAVAAGTEADFLANNFIALDGADINEDGLINDDDVVALRVYLLG
ncbi:MAG: hypothetical protein IJZ75_07130 [Clostridia bacterium]|nr:hypothetical protein [Clostridia bacterium]